MASLRRMIEASMTSVVEITREGGVTYDEFGSEIPSMVTVYSGKALVRPSRKQADSIKAGQQDILLTDCEVILPASAPEVRQGDLVRVVRTWGGAEWVVGAKIVVLSAAIDEWAGSGVLACQRVS